MTIKLVIGNKDGKTVQQELSDEQSSNLIGKKIGTKISGNDLGFEGYEFEVTGGSDNSGTPMRKDVEGPVKKRVFCVEGTGVHKKRKGQKQRKTVSGNTVSEKTSQVNMKILKAGKAPLGEAPEEAPAEGAEDKKEEAKVEPKKEEAKPEEKKEEKAEKKPAEEKKEEEKKE